MSYEMFKNYLQYIFDMKTLHFILRLGYAAYLGYGMKHNPIYEIQYKKGPSYAYLILYLSYFGRKYGSDSILII